MKRRKISGGVYLVVDPMPGWASIGTKLKSALEGGVDVIQIWANWDHSGSQSEIIPAVCYLSHEYGVPVLINNHWQLMKGFPLDGVHFDEVPLDYDAIKADVDRPFVAGITCGNDLQRVRWAVDNHMDYISFCSMFASPTATSCELVSHDVVKLARASTAIPIYVAGGVTVENLHSLVSLGIDGVATVSAVINAESPAVAAAEFKSLLHRSNVS